MIISIEELIEQIREWVVNFGLNLHHNLPNSFTGLKKSKRIV